LLPLLDWIPSYRRDWILFDFLAGLARWAVMMPEAMAYSGTIEGAPYRAAIDERRSARNRRLERRNRAACGSAGCADQYAQSSPRRRSSIAHTENINGQRRKIGNQGSNNRKRPAARLTRHERGEFKSVRAAAKAPKSAQCEGAPVGRSRVWRANSSSLAMFPGSAASKLE